MRAGIGGAAGGLALVAGIAAGCTSVESRYVGQPSHLEEVGGMPIVVQRPRWLKLTYRDVVYGTRRATVTEVLADPVPIVGGGGPVADDGPIPPGGGPIPPGGGPVPPGGGPIAPGGGAKEWRRVTGSTDVVAYDALPPVVEIEAEVLKVGEVYALDFKRPLFGTIQGDIQFPTKAEATDPKDYQYPKKVGATVDDQTLKKLNELIPSVTKKLMGISAGAAEPKPPGDAVLLSSKITCVELYDLRSTSDVPAFCFPAGCGQCGRCAGRR